MRKKTLRVLIVDDNKDGADSLGLLLEQLGYTVQVAYDGKTAINTASAFKPDLMLVDLIMPNMDGCGLAMRIRSIPALKQIKIVAITGQEGEEHQFLALMAGCDEVISKPASLKGLKKILSNTEKSSLQPA